MSYIPMPQGVVAPIAMAGVPGAGLIPTMGGAAGVQQMQAFGLLRKARGAFVGGAVMAFSAGLLQIFAMRFTFWEISNDNVDIKFSLPTTVLSCDSAQTNCVTESISDYVNAFPNPTSTLPPMSKAVFACLVVACTFLYFTGAVSLVMARRVNVLLGVAAWQPYTYGTGNMAVAAWLVQRPLTVMRLALFAQIFAMLSWSMYIGPILSFSQNLSNLSPTGFTSAPGIGYILACVAAALVMMMVIMTSRAGRRLLAAEAILAAGMMAGGVATVATLPGAGGFVTVAGGVMPGMGLGAPGGAVAVTMPGASSDGYYPTNPGAGYPGGGYPGGGYPAGAQAVPLPPAGGYAPPTEYGKSMY